MLFQPQTWKRHIFLNKQNRPVNNTCERGVDMAVINICKDNFENEVRKSDVPVLVDFYAGWCTPCRMMSPVLEDISDRLAGKAKVVKVDVMSETELAGMYRILNVPTMMVFKNGEITDTLVGATGKEQIMSVLR